MASGGYATERQAPSSRRRTMSFDGSGMASAPRLGPAAVRRRDPGRRPAHPRPRRRGQSHRSRPARESIPAHRRRMAPSQPRYPARRTRDPLSQHLPGSGRPLGPASVCAHRADTDSAPRRTPHRIVPSTGNLRKLKNPNPNNQLSLVRPGELRIVRLRRTVGTRAFGQPGRSGDARDPVPQGAGRVEVRTRTPPGACRGVFDESGMEAAGGGPGISGEAVPRQGRRLQGRAGRRAPRSSRHRGIGSTTTTAIASIAAPSPSPSLTRPNAIGPTTAAPLTMV